MSSDFKRSEIFMMIGIISFFILIGCAIFGGINYFTNAIKLDIFEQQIYGLTVFFSFISMIIFGIIGLNLDDREKEDLVKFID